MLALVGCLEGPPSFHGDNGFVPAQQAQCFAALHSTMFSGQMDANIFVVEPSLN